MKIKYFEDFKPGDSATFGKYVMEKDEMIEYAKKWDPQPFHIDEEKAADSVYKGLTASGAHIFAISYLLIMQREIKVKVIGMLGIKEMKFEHPARPGDILTMTHECVDKRESKSKKDRGIVQNKIILKNQKGEIVLTFLDTVMIAKRS